MSESDLATLHTLPQRTIDVDREVATLVALGELAAGIAHEINTPIQFIDLNLRFLRTAIHDLLATFRRCEMAPTDGELTNATLRSVHSRRSDPTGELSYLLAEIPVALEHALEGLALVSEIAEAVTCFAHPSEHGLSSVDANDLVRQSLVLSSHTWRHRAQVESHLCGSPILVPCRPGPLIQALINVLVNAADAIEEKFGVASHERGRIIVSTRTLDKAISIEIADNGQGMAADTRERAFDRYFTTKARGRGTGQGLGIVKSIVEAHRGNVEISSEPDTGTSVRIVIPIAVGEMHHRLR